MMDARLHYLLHCNVLLKCCKFEKSTDFIVTASFTIKTSKLNVM